MNRRVIILSIITCLILTFSTPASAEMYQIDIDEVYMEYGQYISEVEINGEFKLTLFLDETSKTSVLFAYSFKYADVILRSDTTNLTSPDGVHLANGTLQPGQTVEITHRITECLIDILPAIIFEFNKTTNDTALLFLTIDVISTGDQNCGSQIGTFEPNISIIVVLLAVIIIILFWFFSKLWEERSKSTDDPVQPKQKRMKE
jgi:uncharacterized membrane protein